MSLHTQLLKLFTQVIQAYKIRKGQREKIEINQQAKKVRNGKGLVFMIVICGKYKALFKKKAQLFTRTVETFNAIIVQHILNRYLLSLKHISI